MTTYLQISEGSQQIVAKTQASEFEPQNDFIGRLVAKAREFGEATAEDAEGCEVTCTVWEETIEIVGKSVQHDKSGVGHCWVSTDESNCPATIQEEIAAEIIDGKMGECDDYVATNGQHYRWS